jgi:hypothetical protein
MTEQVEGSGRGDPASCAAVVARRAARRMPAARIVETFYHTPGALISREGRDKMASRRPREGRET